MAETRRCPISGIDCEECGFNECLEDLMDKLIDAIKER